MAKVEEALLVMIRHAVVDGAGAVELFEEEEVGHVVGGGHWGEGKAEGCAGFEGVGEAVGAAEDRCYVVAEVFVGFEEGGEGFGGVFGANGVENDEDVATGNGVVNIIAGFHDFFRKLDEFFETKAEFIPNCGKRATGEGADGDEGEFDHKGES